jgi:hypothetical protein
MTLYVSMLFYPLYEVAKRCDCKIKLFHDPTVFDIQYSLLQNNIFKLEIKLYLLSTGTIDQDQLFFRNLLSEQVYVFFLFVKFSIVLQIRICGQAIYIFNDKLTNSTTELQNYLGISEHNRLVVFLVCYSLVSNYRVISFLTRVVFLVSRYSVLKR